ncbi:hypothetical protein RV11_GL003187 [Enterococcus phoeniculicola]|uniref:Uncharacterized protein n=1 Tax=Enterococcus phoeniculicola ATCC BAA-412 TaxID=1158610 RepID=R3TNC9_9ENTE|nr:hypothetical protein [Enterococcus phoeniculicola]EOL42994.1 hypothetical protein UC3_01971 [Enterococcus phoeniculicola ATCC BAA-412]EOT76648.1 hypothetical protein I589_01605 [Enterococcus phoeniculicola ATCC BAA-412]OJG72216.1 hypothetical protein RV11_GL003187 [Enterococcus phoeniculicola]
MTHRIDIERPIESKGNEIAIDDFDRSAFDFMTTHILIETAPVESYLSGNFKLNIFNLTNLEMYQVSLLNRGYERNLDYFYLVVDKNTKNWVSGNGSVIYKKNEEEVLKYSKNLEPNKEIIKAEKVFKNGYNTPIFELDHNYTLYDLNFDMQSYEKSNEISDEF